MTQNPNEPTVAELVAGVVEGDLRSWDDIVLRFGGLVNAVVGSHRMQTADSEDAVQNTWLRAVERIHSLRDSECLPAWLVTIARRECVALLRARRERPDAEAADGIAERGLGPELAVLRAEACGAVRGAVVGLPAKRRRLVEVLYYEEDQGYHSASSATGMPIGSIGPTRMRIMSSLREALERAGFDGTDAVPA